MCLTWRWHFKIFNTISTRSRESVYVHSICSMKNLLFFLISSTVVTLPYDCVNKVSAKFYYIFLECQSCQLFVRHRMTNGRSRQPASFRRKRSFSLHKSVHLSVFSLRCIHKQCSMYIYYMYKEFAYSEDNISEPLCEHIPGKFPYWLTYANYHIKYGFWYVRKSKNKLHNYRIRCSCYPNVIPKRWNRRIIQWKCLLCSLKCVLNVNLNQV